MRSLLCIALAALLLSGCSTVGRQNRVNPRYYEAYYDGQYGPFIDGYWGRDERFFWYKDKVGAWRRDTAHHFQRGDGGAMWQLVRGSGAARTNR
jgi:uncharacterized protein YceK